MKLTVSMITMNEEGAVAKVVRDIRGVALTFLDTYLRGDAEGREALEKASSRSGVRVEKK